MKKRFFTTVISLVVFTWAIGGNANVCAGDRRPDFGET